MTNACWCIAAVLLTLTLTGTNLATAQVTVQAEDVIGTWELVSSKDLKTGAVVTDASKTLHWMQLTRSHWMLLIMARGRSVVASAEFEKLSPEEKVKTTHALIWNEQNRQIFMARGGTYRLDGDRLHHTAAIALYPEVIGRDRVLKIIRLDKSTMIVQTEFPDTPTFTREYTYRRIE